MKVSLEVIKWLKDNAYAVIGTDYWLLPEFPPDRIPDRLEIPMRPKKWNSIKGVKEGNGS